MRAQCIICQELFENDDIQVVSALFCGHTFHAACLNQWLESGSTCPSCRERVDRKKIVQRLFFDSPEDTGDVIDESKVQNQLDNLKLEVRKAEKAKNDAIKQAEVREEKIGRLEASCEKLTQQLKQEQSTSSSHVQMLKYYESQQKSLDLEREECKKVKQRLATLQSVETLLNGSESDAVDIISASGEGPGAVQSLSRQVAFLKREYEKLKHEKRQYKDHCDKLQLAERTKAKKLQEMEKKCEILSEQLERSEGDLKIAEKHLDIVKTKNTKLVTKLKKFASQSTSEPKIKGKTGDSGECGKCDKLLQSVHNICDKDKDKKFDTSANSASFNELLNDSARFKLFSASTPKLTTPPDSQGSYDRDLDLTPDIFCSPSPAKTQKLQEDDLLQTGTSNVTQSTAQKTLKFASHTFARSQFALESQTQTKGGKRHMSDDVDENDSENNSQLFKLTSAAEKNSQKLKRFKSESSIKDSNQLLNYAGMNIFKKRELGERNTNKGSIIQRGFDGLGGHTTFVNALGNPFKKPAAKKTVSKLGKMPSLPKLDNFIVLD
ncbi:myosin heavy chain, non-muscle-like [Dreissena polymorpha]|uniref:RING-type domain-containing protein n=1 Tax=Dreissena polymorpha TaxID=45954 RepID=A0A9D4JVT7_DREPO|nr:myosin heavy chain, non-muscle-like [Dreissena polymorpha]KAH3822273.1 hypothetical protein DPMN_124047 [Dreissena polymorpha]